MQRRYIDMPTDPGRRRGLRPTIERPYAFPDHRPPATGTVDADGLLWHGHSTVTNKAARRRRNRRTWAALRAARRRAYLATKTTNKENIAL